MSTPPTPKAPPTPGPWIVGRSQDGTYVIKPDTGTAPWNHADCVAAVRPTDNGDANARLIAAAPATADAARIALAFLESLNGRVSLDVWRDSYDAVKALRSALSPAAASGQGE